ncbi:MAG: methyltransferase domain-containing protein [Leptonema sp. (in: Bacteria)]|nr:methyltransferase domain-containing protein [Leptonema sp. (in: bacteria)]
MRGLPYYEEPSYHKYLLSPERRDLFPVSSILDAINWKDVNNVLDFGMGNGFFLEPLLKRTAPHGHIWGAECQELLIDFILRFKVKNEIQRFTPFFVERTEHPLLPDWIPMMDLVFCSCVLSTFADPTLAIKSVGRAMKSSGQIVIIDWERRDAPSGPATVQKMSVDRMKYCIDEAGCKVTKEWKINQYLYGIIIEKDAVLFEERHFQDAVET